MNDVLRLLCLLQFFPEVAQNSLSFPRSEKSRSIPGFPGLCLPWIIADHTKTHISSPINNLRTRADTDSWRSIGQFSVGVTRPTYAVTVPQEIHDGARTGQTVKYSPVGSVHDGVEHEHEVLVEWLERSAEPQRYVHLCVTSSNLPECHP